MIDKEERLMEKELQYIIVQAGGKGTRMEYLTYNKPKALVAIDNLPMLFHLFRKYPNCKFLVIGDYKYEVLEKYLEAFAEVDYSLVDARGKKGTCAGIVDALKQIPQEEPFLLIWSDLILPADYVMPLCDRDYVGISKDFHCRWSYRSGVFEEEASTNQGVAGHFIFHNKSSLQGLPDEGEFVRWLCEQRKKFEELPLYRTKEYGLLADCARPEAGKCRPFNRITIEGDKIIKEAIDEQGRKLADRECAWYEKVKSKEFRNIPRIYATSPLVMEKIDGKNIFQYDLNFPEKKEVLSQLIGCIREIHALESCPTDEASFYEAYIGKTFERLKKVRKLVPFADEEYIEINGIKCKNIFYCREQVEKMMNQYLPNEFVMLHGDCTFSNMMLKEGKIPMLIDPRGYFGYTDNCGDPAYDWAKIYYSLVGNYDQFNLGRFNLRIQDTNVMLEIESNHWEDMEETFFELLDKEVTREQIKLIHAIIYLSLTTYAWENYDSICGAFYKGVLLLNEVL